MTRVPVLLGAAAGLLIFAIRLHVIARCGSPVPFWDEWDAVFSDALLPFARGHMTLAGLFAANNEHRVVLTRLFDLGLFAAGGGRWRVLAEMVVTQALVSAGAVLLLHALGRGLPPLRRAGLICAGAALLAIPFDWEGQVWAFISQMYFCVALALGALVLIGGSGAGERRFWLGIALALAGAFCFAGAIAGLLAAAGLVALRDVCRPAARTPALLAVALLLAASAALLVTTPAPPVNAGLQAHSLGQFAVASAATLSWPMPPGTGVILWLPAIIFLGRHMRRGMQADPLFWMLAGLALWCLLIGAEIAFARAGAPVLSRYTIFLGVAALVNLSCLLRLLPPRPGRLPAALGAGWLALIAAGAWHAARSLPADIADRRATADVQIANVARYLRTGNEAALDKGGFAIPYPNGKALAILLRSGIETGVLPETLRTADLPRDARWRKNLAKAGTIVGLTGGMFVLLSIGVALSRRKMGFGPDRLRQRNA